MTPVIQRALRSLGAPIRVRALGLLPVVALVLLAIPSSASGAVRTWNGGGATNNWNDAGNWVGGLIPGAADVATFDATSSKNATINVTINVGGVDVAGTYGGTITQAAGSAVTVGASGFSQIGGTFTGGSNAITVNGPLSLGGGTFASTSATLTVGGNIVESAAGVFSAGAGTVALNGGAATIDVVTSETFNNLTFTAGAKTIAAGDTLTVNATTTLIAGSVNGGTVAARGAITEASTFGGGTASLLIDGLADQTFTGSATTAAGTLPAVVIDKPSGTLTLAVTAGAVIRTTNSWTFLAAGALDPGTSTVVFAGNGTVSGSQPLNNVQIRGAVSIPAGTALALAGSFTMPTAVVLTLNGSITVAGQTSLTDGTLNGTGSLHAEANISQASTYDGGTASLLIDGPADQTFTGSATTVAGTLPAVVIDKPSGTLTLAVTAGAVIRTTNSWTFLAAGALDPGTSTVVFAGNGTVSGSQPLNNVQIRGAVSIPAGTALALAGSFTMPTAVVLTLNGSITVAGQTSLTDGTLNGTGSLHAEANISQASTYDGGTASLLIDGPADQTFTGSATTVAGTLPAVVIDKPSGTLTLAVTAGAVIRTTNSWTFLAAGSLDPGSSTVVFAGNGTVSGSQPLNNVQIRGAVSIPAGTALALAGSFTMPTAVVLTLNGSITVAGQTSLTDGTLNGTGSLHAEANISQASTYDGGTASLLIDGPADQTFTGSATTVAGTLPAVVIDKPSGTLTLAVTAGAVIRTTNSWTFLAAGSLDPGSSTVVFAGNGTVSGSQPLNNVQIRGAVSIPAGTALALAGSFTMPTAVVLTLNGSITVAGQTSLTDGTLNGTGSLHAEANISQASTYDGGTASLLIDGPADQTFTGSATTVAGTLPAVVIDKPSGTLTLAVTAGAVIRTTNSWTFLAAGSLDPGSSTVVFAGNGTVSGSQPLNNVQIRGAVSIPAGTALALAGSFTMPTAVVLTLNGSITVAGQTSLTDGTLNGTGSLHAEANISQASTYDGGTASLLIDGPADQTFTGSATTVAGTLPAVVIDKPSGTLTLAVTAGAVIRTTNSWTFLAAGSLDPGSSTVVFAGNASVDASGMSFHDLATNGGTRTLASALNVNHDLTILAGTMTTSAGSHAINVLGNLTVNGTLTANASLITVAGDIAKTGTFTAGTSTVVLDGSAGQTISGTAWVMRNLQIANAAGVTMATNVSVTGVLTLVTGPFVIGPRLLTIANPIGGVSSNLTADASSSISVVGVAAGIIIPDVVTQLLNLTVNDAAGVTLAADLIVNGILTLTTGPITTGSFILEVAPAGSVVRTSGRVAGYLRKTAPVASPAAMTFEIGDAAAYTPASLAFGTVTVAGKLTAWTTSGEHPDIVNSGLDPAHDVNRYWTVINAGATFDAYSATFRFVAADIDSGSGPLLFRVAKNDGATWTMPAAGTRTALTTQATGMTGFSEFAVGEPTADLSVTVDDGVGAVVAGDGLTYTYLATVTNAGPSDATAVVLTDTWPAGFSQATIGPSQGSCAAIGPGPDLSCALGTIAAGASATVSLDFTVPAGLAAGPQTNTASVTSAVLDSDPSDDSASDTDIVGEVADLTVAKDDGQIAVVAGTGGYAYTITVANGGPSDADGLAISDPVPTALTAGVPTADLGGDCSASSGNAISCSLPASLAPGATWTISVPYAVAASVAPITVVNRVTATSDENPLGISAADATDVVISADLSVTVDDGVGAVVAGDGLTYTYLATVTNAGPSDATAVVLTDTWPAGFSQATIGPSQGSCAAIGPGPDLSCALGTIAAGASATVSLDFTVPAGLAAGPQTNTASVTSAVLDSDPSDDSASDTDIVVLPAPTPSPSVGPGPIDLPSSDSIQVGPLKFASPIALPALALLALVAALFVLGLWGAHRHRPSDASRPHPRRPR